MRPLDLWQLFPRIGCTQVTIGWAGCKLQFLVSSFILSIVLLGVLYSTKLWNSDMDINNKRATILVWKWALECSPTTECSRAVETVPRTGTEWEAESQGGSGNSTKPWFQPRLTWRQWTMTPSPLVPGDLPSLLLLQTQRERSANLDSNSSLCFMLRELCKGFTFCLDGFPEQGGFLLVSVFYLHGDLSCLSKSQCESVSTQLPMGTKCNCIFAKDEWTS